MGAAEDTEFININIIEESSGNDDDFPDGAQAQPTLLLTL
jgi:hypothetical protein